MRSQVRLLQNMGYPVASYVAGHGHPYKYYLFSCGRALTALILAEQFRL